MGSRRLIDRGTVVAAALLVVRADGLAALTLRRLADDLGVTAAALYRHVRDKDELVSLLGDAVFEQVELPTAADGDWAEQLAIIARRTRTVLADYPGLGLYVVDSMRIFPSANALRLADASLRLLLQAGFDPKTAATAQFALRHFASAGLPVDPSLRAAVMSVPVNGFESLYAVGPFLSPEDADAGFEFGLRCFLTALRIEAGSASSARP